MRWLLLLLSLSVFAQFTPPSGGGSSCGPNCTVSGTLTVSGAATIVGTTTISTTLLGTSTSTYAALSLTENGTITGSPTATQHAPIEINIHSASVNSRDIGIAFRCFGSGTSGCPTDGTTHDFFMGFDGDNVFILGTQGYFSDGSVATMAFLQGTYPEIFDAVQIVESTGRNGTPELLISPGYAHTGPAIKVMTQGNGSQVFAVDNPTGNTAIAGTLQVTGHTTLEGVTSTGATGTGNLVFSGSPTLTTPALGAATATSVSAATLYGGGTTSSFPMWVRNGAGWDGKLADASGFANIEAGNIRASGALAFTGTNGDRLLNPTATVWGFTNNSGTGATRVNFGPGSNPAFPSFSVTTQTNPILKLQDANGGDTADFQIGNQKSSSGTRYVCIDTTGKLVSSATACVGT